MNHVASRRMPGAALLSLSLVAVVGVASATASTPSTSAMSIAVSNCNDSGSGSLRAAIARAVSGDTIDMRGLTCRAITLSGGAIVIPQANLGLLGPGYAKLSINGSGDRVLNHRGTGLLRLTNLSVANGKLTTPYAPEMSGESANGGCIYTAGSIELRGVRVHDCRATGGSQMAAGGGIFAVGAVSLIHSWVVYSRAVAAYVDNLGNYHGYSYGGGVYSGGLLTVDHVRLGNNVVTAGTYASHDSPSMGGGAFANAGLVAGSANILANTSESQGAGLYISGNTTITNSTVQGNNSKHGAGGIYSVAGSLTLRNSTLSNNTGSFYVGVDDDVAEGSAISARQATISNSTIAFNHNTGAQYTCGGAVDAGTLQLDSTIVAKNLCSDGAALDIFSNSISGSHDLIQAATSPLPAGTITADPQLLPLAYNGGPTPTRALAPASPAIDVGSNPAGLHYDQRGAGFPRVKGAHTDIGAYEY